MIDKQEINSKLHLFERYMTAEKWDRIGDSGINSDDGLDAINAFIEFAITGEVTLNDEDEEE